MQLASACGGECVTQLTVSSDVAYREIGGFPLQILPSGQLCCFAALNSHMDCPCMLEAGWAQAGA